MKKKTAKKGVAIKKERPKRYLTPPEKSAILKKYNAPYMQLKKTVEKDSIDGYDKTYLKESLGLLEKVSRSLSYII